MHYYRVKSVERHLHALMCSGLCSHPPCVNKDMEDDYRDLNALVHEGDTPHFSLCSNA